MSSQWQKANEKLLWSLEDLISKAESVANQINPASEVVIHSQHEIEVLILVLAAWFNNTKPILDPKKMLHSTIFYDHLDKKADRNSVQRTLKLDPLWEIGFSTSGSTGKPKVITRRLDGLINEVNAFKDQFSLISRGLTISLVSPVHIYGFIHSFLLPIATQSQVNYIDSINLSTLNSDCQILLTVPAQWSAVKLYLKQNNVHLLVSSGASFGDRRATELQLAYNDYCEEAIEILGSTETGGIGYKSLLESNSPYKFFEGVSIVTRHKKQLLNSAFAPEYSEFPLQDRLLETTKGHFLHLGRIDRVFKFSGKRWDLADIEKKILQLEGVIATKAHFLVDENRPKGGILLAWIVLKSEVSLSPAVIQARYRSITDNPCPDLFQIIDSLPKDRHGKVSVASLLETVRL